MMYSPMRVGGLASGMDIDQIVDDLMRAEHMKVDKLHQRKQIMEWQKAEYRNINLKLRNLYDTTFDMKLSKSYLEYKAIGSMNDGSDFDQYFTVSPGSGAIPGEYKVKIEQAADYAKLESKKSIAKPLVGNVLNEDTITIKEGNNQISITIDGIEKIVTFDSNTYNIKEFAKHMQNVINDAFSDGYDTIDRIKVDIIESEEGYKFTIEPQDNFNKVPITLNKVENNDLLSNLGFGDKATYRPINPQAPLNDQISGEIGNLISFNINGHEFEFSSNTSLQTIIDKINTTADVNVKAHYDPLTDKFILLSRETGRDAKIEIKDNSGFFDAIGLNSLDASGKNARIELNGTIVEKSTNDFTVNGIRFSINKAMDANDEAIFRLENDPDAAVENIKEYIDLYNETITLINDKLSEKRYRDFPPLTDAQKKEMSEDDIKLWEEKAKSGHLRSDPLLDRIVRNLRNAISTPVAGLPKDMNSLSAIGITTGDWREKGILHIDEKKLRDAITKDPETVMRLFNIDGENFSSKGVANRIYDILKGGINEIVDKAGGGEFQKYDNSHLGKQIRNMEKRIDEWEERLWRTEERYWRQFTAMEKAISTMNQQSMWLASQMGLWG